MARQETSSSEIDRGVQQSTLVLLERVGKGFGQGRVCFGKYLQETTD